MKLQEKLSRFEGKHVVLQMSIGEKLLAMDGVVKRVDDEYILHNERQIILGQPMPTNMGMMQPEEIVPEHDIHFGDIESTAIFAIKVLKESVEEAKKLLETNKPMITAPPRGPLPGAGGRSGFIPG